MSELIKGTLVHYVSCMTPSTYVVMFYSMAHSCRYVLFQGPFMSLCSIPGPTHVVMFYSMTHACRYVLFHGPLMLLCSIPWSTHVIMFYSMSYACRYVLFHVPLMSLCSIPWPTHVVMFYSMAKKYAVFNINFNNYLIKSSCNIPYWENKGSPTSKCVVELQSFFINKHPRVTFLLSV